MIKKYRRRVKRYEKRLDDELKMLGGIHDGGGVRYEIGPIYVLINDIPGALKAYHWFENTFQDDWGDPIHSLSWALALYRNGDFEKASNKLIQTMFKNVYLVEHLIGKKIKPYDIWHASNYEEPEYLEYVPAEYLEMWGKEEIEWAKNQFNSNLFQKLHNRYLQIYKALKTTKSGPERSALLDEMYKYHDLDFDLLKQSNVRGYNGY